MIRVFYCGWCKMGTEVHNNQPYVMTHSFHCPRKDIKNPSAYTMAFGAPEERIVSDVDKRRADSGWLYVDQPICGCGVDVSDISIENTITSYTQDDSTKTVICMQWHRLCYVNALV